MKRRVLSHRAASRTDPLRPGSFGWGVTRVRWRYLSLLSAAALLVGCSAGADSPDASDPPTFEVDTSNLSPEQAAEVEDGVVTADEYEAAFQRFRNCMSASGFELGDVEFTGLLYDYSVAHEAVVDGADAECYDAEFLHVDMIWQGSDAVQNSSDTAEFFRECLQGRGIEPADTLKEMSQQLRDAGIEPAECL